jgi:hypothetical protein
MSGGFVKIYGSILDSSIWSTDLATRVVWVTLLTMADRHGMVTASIDGIARRANVTLEQATQALEVLKSPDHQSKSKTFSGRRVRSVELGFLVLNYAKYREHRTDAQVKAAERVRRFRETHREALHVTDVTAGNAVIRAEAEAYTETTTTARETSKPRPALPQYDQLFTEAWSVYPKRPNHSKGAAWRQWLARVAEGIDPLDMLEGARRYARLVVAEGTEPRFVKHAATFFGRDRHFENDMAATPPKDSLAARVVDLVTEEDAAIARTMALLATRGAA